MKNITLFVMILVIGGNIVANAEQYNQTHPIIHTAQAQNLEPKVVLIEVKPTVKTIEEKIRIAFPEEPNTAVAVAKAESVGLKADAYNPEWHYDRNGNKLCQGSYGLMQIACVHNIENPDALFDVDFNIKKAKEVFERGGWKQWGAYTDGSYLKHLK